jgi:ubiquinone/menaquinone biosynthesis C-methylase UbiE
VSEHETERIGRRYDEWAGGYDRTMRWFDRLLIPGGREWLCEGARGRVLEVGVGTGRNLPYYGPDVDLAGVDASAGMLALAEAATRRLGREADLRVGDAQALPFAEASFDTVVICLALCTIPDPALALREARRVLRPGGELRLLEHVRSPNRPVRIAQRLLDPLSVRFQADHLLREPLDHLPAAGFALEHLERSRLGFVERLSAR